VTNRPKYQVVLDKLHRDIITGHYSAGQKLPSEAALVQRFGVSRITVGHAVSELQRQGLIDRIAGSGTYVRATSPAREGLVFGLVIPNLGETEIFEPICQAIASSPGSTGHALLWPHADTGSTREDQALALASQCIARRVSGVFFAPLELSPHSAEINRRVMKMLRDAGIAVVLLDRRPDDGAVGDRCDLAGLDNHRAGYIATEHLRQLRSRRIGFMGYRDQASTVKLRIAGYREALGESATPRVFLLPPEERMTLQEAALECDAFVCANDRVAARLMHALMARKVRIPRDVRIVGIDDVNYAGLLPVPLTTVRQPCREIGEAALRLMLDRLDRPKMPAREVLVDCALTIRDSCGAKKDW
jgi:GntR family transcriptional regulator, arabinose operon transcriptional repressor